jgi:prevent-host-death family protein
MRRVPLENVQAKLGQYVTASAKGPVLILRDGEPVAVLVGLARNRRRAPRKLRDVLKAAWKDYEEYGGLAHQKFWTTLRKEAGKS